MKKRGSVVVFPLLIILVILCCLTGCKKPTPPGWSKDTSYDPAKDPLVNPPIVFEEPPEDLSKIDTDHTLYLQLDGNPKTLNPIFVSSSYEMTVVGVLYEGLFTFDKDMIWQVNEEMVESFEESEDHTTFIVKMDK